MAQEQPLEPGQLPDQDNEVRRLLQAGHSAAANTLFDQIVGHTPPVTDPPVRAALLVNRAILAWQLGRIPLALELAAEGWTDLSASHQEGTAAAHTLSLLGFLLEGIGHRRAALDTLRYAVRIARDAGDERTLAHTLQRLGGTLNFRAIEAPAETRLPIFEEARDALAEGLRLDAAEPRMHRALLGAYGCSLAGVGDLDRAAEVAQQVLEQGIEHGELWTEAVGNWVLARVSRQRGELLEARTRASRAVAEAEQIKDTSLLLRFSQDLADICAELEDPVGEAIALRRSVAAARTATDTLREGLGQAMEQRRIAAQAQRLAMAAQEAAARDPLTGLANRLGLERSAPALLEAAAGAGRTSWLVLVDVDWFKGVNDDAGHAAGDAALREIAQLLRNECRSDDLVARWAGDEFVVLIDDGGGRRDAGPVVAERIRAAVADHDWTLVLGAVRQPTVSIGVASGSNDLDALFSSADIGLYQAKREGRNRVAVYQPLQDVGEFAG